MKALISLLIVLVIFPAAKIYSQTKLDSIFPVRGFCIAAPRADRLDEFIKFINSELVSRKVNTLVLRVDYNYQYQSHPELRDKEALSKADVKKLVNTCRKAGIRIIPQVNLLGHQSWASDLGKLLEKYPEFDETPHIKLPEKYVWPNQEGLYCKSYCPLHPGVHKVVFEVVDEICDAFETDAFHAGMDEVFYIGHDSCKRCSGRDKAELFAGEVRTIRDHLAQKNRKLWIWGDRLIDGKTTGLGMWEASFNNTHRAVDMIPKDVMICDWHYERADLTPVYFAMKGLNVITCPWRMPALAATQAGDMAKFRKQSTPEMSNRFNGMMQTVWSDTGSFLDEFYGKKKTDEKTESTPSNCFRSLYTEILKYNQPTN
jgi:N-acetyl-beta-hexosaminidase